MKLYTIVTGSRFECDIVDLLQPRETEWFTNLAGFLFVDKSEAEAFCESLNNLTDYA